MRLTAHDLAGERGGEPVFAGVSFALTDGEALVVTGPNGAGKSTLLRVVAGLLPAAAGTVRLEARNEQDGAGAVESQGSSEQLVGGSPPPGGAQRRNKAAALLQADGEEPSIASASHYLGHCDAMKPALSVAENLRFWRDLLGGGGLSPAQALDSVGLAAIGPAPFAYLSAGQKRRAAIARLLLAPRPIWLLDEPTAGLDKASEARLGELMQAHRENGGIIVAATHQPLGLHGAEELKLGAASPSPLSAPLSPLRAPPSALRGGSLRDAERGGGA